MNLTPKEIAFRKALNELLKTVTDIEKHAGNAADFIRAVLDKKATTRDLVANLDKFEDMKNALIEKSKTVYEFAHECVNMWEEEAIREKLKEERAAK